LSVAPDRLRNQAIALDRCPFDYHRVAGSLRNCEAAALSVGGPAVPRGRTAGRTAARLGAPAASPDRRAHRRRRPGADFARGIASRRSSRTFAEPNQPRVVVPANLDRAVPRYSPFLAE